MGAVAEMLRKRERREPRSFSWWDVLWVLPIGGVFFAGNFVIPSTGSRWLDALLWAGYGLLWGAIALVVERAVRRARHLAPAEGFLPRPVAWVMMVTILLVGRQFVPKGSDLWAGVPGAVAFVVVTVVHQILTSREARH